MPQKWDIDVKAARAQQEKLARLVQKIPLNRPINAIAGADCAFSPNGQHCIAAIIVLSWPDLQPIAQAHSILKVDFPYIPGLLSFREAPALIAAAEKLKITPDVLIIDGQGLAHPRRFGLASHVGVELDWPTIGCAKSRLIGAHRTPALRKGARCRLLDDQEVIGMVLRTRHAVKCLYISVGHRIQLPQAVEIVLRCCPRYRLPETTRLSHHLVSNLRLKFAHKMLK